MCLHVLSIDCSHAKIEHCLTCKLDVISKPTIQHMHHGKTSYSRYSEAGRKQIWVRGIDWSQELIYFSL